MAAQRDRKQDQPGRDSKAYPQFYGLPMSLKQRWNKLREWLILMVSRLGFEPRTLALKDRQGTIY